MATLAELIRQRTALSRDETHHLQRLVSDWGMLADFCFADLLLYLPTRDGQWVVVAQVRPATGQTLYLNDYVGAVANPDELAILSHAYEHGEQRQGEVSLHTMP